MPNKVLPKKQSVAPDTEIMTSCPGGVIISGMALPGFPTVFLVLLKVPQRYFWTLRSVLGAP